MVIRKTFQNFLFYDRVSEKFNNGYFWFTVDLKRIVIFADSNFNLFLRKPSRELYRKLL